MNGHVDQTVVLREIPIMAHRGANPQPVAGMMSATGSAPFMDHVGLEQSNRYGWEGSARAWIEGADLDPNRIHVLDPAMERLCGDVAGLRAADIGSGEGRFCRRLAARGARCLGIEPVVAMACAAVERAPRIPVVLGDAQRLPVANDCLDLAVAYLSLIDVPDFRRAIAEVARALRPDGRFVLAIVHPMMSADRDWIRGDDGRLSHVAVDRYFEEQGKVAEWDGVRVVNWHRPLEDYFQALLSAGLVLEAFEEPRPEGAAAADDPSLAIQRRAPSFVAMRWRKP